MSKKILITGANGFLGSNLVRLALKKKYSVNALVRSKSNLKNLEKHLSKINLYYGDVRDIESLNDPIRNSDIIFHVAADYRLWAKKISELYETNVYGTENILSLVSRHNKKLIFTSSVATLGIIDNKVSTEKTPVNFNDMIGHYKRSKYLAEELVLNYVKKKKNQSNYN